RPEWYASLEEVDRHPRIALVLERHGCHGRSRPAVPWGRASAHGLWRPGGQSGSGAGSGRCQRQPPALPVVLSRALQQRSADLHRQDDRACIDAVVERALAFQRQSIGLHAVAADGVQPALAGEGKADRRRRSDVSRRIAAGGQQFEDPRPCLDPAYRFSGRWIQHGFGRAHGLHGNQARGEKS
nr:hypothetical protein [Tanacetum cinerariifolium]